MCFVVVLVANIKYYMLYVFKWVITVKMDFLHKKRMKWGIGIHPWIYDNVLLLR